MHNNATGQVATRVAAKTSSKARFRLCEKKRKNRGSTMYALRGSCLCSQKLSLLATITPTDSKAPATCPSTPPLAMRFTENALCKPGRAEQSAMRGDPETRCSRDGAADRCTSAAQITAPRATHPLDCSPSPQRSHPANTQRSPVRFPQAG